MISNPILLGHYRQLLSLVICIVWHQFYRHYKLLHYWQTSGYAPRGLWWHFKCLFFWFKSLQYLSMLRSSLYVTYLCCVEISLSKNKLDVFCNTTLPRERPIGSAVCEILWYTQTNKQTDKHTSCYFIIRIRYTHHWRAGYWYSSQDGNNTWK